MFNWTDYVIVAILCLSTLISLMRGFVREAMSLITWIVAFWLAFKFHNYVADFLTSYIKAPSLRMIVAFAVIFIIILIVGSIINYLMREVITSTGLGSTDRVLGVCFGVMRGILLLGVMILLGNIGTFSHSSWWQQSVLIPHFQGLSNWLHGFVPAKFIEMHSNI